MAKEDVLAHIEDVIRIARLEIKRQKSCKADQMRQLTGLVNAYTRLLTHSEILDADADGEGDPDYYDKLISDDVE